MKVKYFTLKPNKQETSSLKLLCMFCNGNPTTK